MLDRRQLLKSSGLLLGGDLVFGSLLSPTLVSRAHGEPVPKPLPPLPRLDREQIVYVERDSPDADAYAKSYNSIAAVTPRVRAMCKTPHAVSAMVEWARMHQIHFALRSGGHSFEGFSQSADFVIDTRLMNSVEFDRSNQIVQVGSGARLSNIYPVVGKEGHAIPSGYCQSVGIAGIALGGGIGYLTRHIGLTCDVLRAVELVDAEGRRLIADAQTHPDLFWACRGGGGGSFGVATRFTLSTATLPHVVVFAANWVVSPEQGADLLAAWQSWGAPDDIATKIYLTKASERKLLLRLRGQSVGGAEEVLRHVSRLDANMGSQTLLVVRHLPFADAINQFSHPHDRPTWRFKAKSHLISEPIPRRVLQEMLKRFERTTGEVFVSFEALGGAAGRIGEQETAFPHRRARLSIQYSTKLPAIGSAGGNMQSLSELYTHVHPYASRGVYVNYPDMELADWPRAYWGSNLERLIAIKRKYDPGNIFKHPQSVPLQH